GTATANSTTYSDTGLSGSTTYYYRVRANRDNAKSNYSNETNAVTSAAPSSSGGSSGGGGCFIATAAYGTPMAKEVKVLCEFRDKYLLKHPFGKSFIKTYYYISPAIAQHISGKPYLRALIRQCLKPLVKFCALTLSQ
ncbi:MAG: fibronectin type III domain-containing protein, partial [Candidatus Firestonebacteria bacterium]